MKRAFETAECETVWSSIFWELRYEKHENRMKEARSNDNSLQAIKPLYTLYIVL